MKYYAKHIRTGEWIATEKLNATVQSSSSAWYINGTYFLSDVVLELLPDGRGKCVVSDTQNAVLINEIISSEDMMQIILSSETVK